MSAITKLLLRVTLLLLVMRFYAPERLLAQEEPAGQQKSIPLSRAIESIGKRFHIQFAYEHKLLEGKHTSAKSLQGDNLQEVLKNVLYPNNLLFLYVSENAYSIVARDSRFFQNGQGPAGNSETGVGTASPVAASKHTLRGMVIDERGVAIHFANVWVKGTRRGTQTSDRGDFVLEDLEATDSLEFSFVGYRSEMIPAGRLAVMTVQLYPAGKATMEEVTVVSTGLQQLPKERATGAFSTISGKTLEQIPVGNLVNRLEGQVAGVKINVMAGDRSFIYGSTGNQISVNGGTRTVGKNDYNVSIRGTSSVIGETFPLVVVDGAITDLDISTLNPDDVENIVFLKDAAAASIWGVRAANGVIVVTTKKGRISQEPNISFTATASVAGRPDLNYLRLMNSAQSLSYEKELVDRGFLNSSNIDGSQYYSAGYYPNQGAVLALQLQAGGITQSQYQHSIDSLSAIDNRGQIQHYLLRPATSQEYNLAVSGGNNSSNYYYSASYSKEDANARRMGGQRLTLTMNNSWKLLKTATLSASLRGAFFTYDQNGLGISSLYARQSNVLMPYMNLADASGKGISYNRLNPDFTSSLSSTYLNWQYNYLDELNNNDNVQKDDNYSATVNLSVPIYKGISASLQYQNERTFSNTRVFYDPQSYYFRNLVNYYTDPSASSNGLGITSGGILNTINTTVNNYSVRGQLAYDRTIKLIHQINAIGGIEARQTQTGQATETYYGYNMQTGISVPVSYLSYVYPTVAGYTSSLGGGPTQTDKRRRYLSYFGNASYTLMGKYTLSGSARYDDYNNFGVDRKYRATPLWSAGAKWMLSKESFLSDVKWLNTLGLRLTYGVNGNISTTMYPFTYIGLLGNDWSTGLPEADVVGLANPALKWEKTYVTNLGVDFSLFGSRLNGAFDVYRKNGEDLFFNFPINAAYAGSIGGYYLTRNAAAMTGRGVDMSMNGVVMQGKDFSWNLGLTFSYNINKLKSDRLLDSSTVSAYYSSYYPSAIGNLGGYSLDKLLVYRNAGLDANGLTQVYDRKGTKVGVSSPVYFADLKNAGHTVAPYFGGFNTTARYKQFSLYALLTYQFGGVFLRPSIRTYNTSYYLLDYDISGDIAHRWQQSGDEGKTNVPGLNGSSSNVAYSLNRYQNSDINVLSSNYIRLREISLSYDLPALWLNKVRAKGASIGFGVRNLGLLWKANKDGYDPDFIGYANTTYSLPAARSYNFSLKLNY